MSKILEEVLSANSSYVASFADKGELALPPARSFAILTCMDARLDPRARAMLDHALSCSIVGSAETVRLGLDAFIARTGADELMVTAQIHHHADRLRSFAILAEVAMPVMV